MTQEHARDFLQRMSSDPDTRQEVVEEYKKLLQDLAAQKGFAFSDEELVSAARELTDAAAGEVADAALVMVTGGGGAPANPGEGRFLMTEPPGPGDGQFPMAGPPGPGDPHSGGPGIPV